MIKVLDHGYVRFIEAWGKGEYKFAVNQADDFERGIVEAARQSTSGSFRGWDQDEKLLRHLYSSNPKHATPFEFAGMVIEVQAPIFVFREWQRHRTQGYNEMSARYTPLPDVNYLPSAEQILKRSLEASTTKNKQAGSLAPYVTSLADAHRWLKRQQAMYADFEEQYQSGLAMGIPKEIARIGMPVGRYSKMRATTSLRNWLAFLTLRMDPRAQWEIREYAVAVGRIIAETFPITWRMFALEMEERNGSGR